MWSSWARPVLPRASLASPARWHMVHSIHANRHTVYWVQAQVGFGRVYFPGPNRVGARAHFMRWAQPILRLSRRACARANDGLACVNAGQPLMKNLSHFVKSVLYIVMKLYSLLVLTKNIFKIMKKFKALKKTKIVFFPGRILPCKQTCVQYITLYTTNTHRLRP